MKPVLSNRFQKFPIKHNDPKCNHIKNKIFCFFIFLFLSANTALAEDTIIKIGVLANRGPERCMEKWFETAEYLSSNIPGNIFHIVPIDYDQIDSMVEKSQVDFILANSACYIELESKYRVNRIATLKNSVRSKAETSYGAVIFCKKEREDIRHLIDLKGKTFRAVNDSSFGGWRMAWRELKDAGVDPFKDFAFLGFAETHDIVVYAVRDGIADAGTVRTGTFEMMNAEGKINIDDFHVIHEHGGDQVDLPFVHSSRLYPEWPMAKLKHISNELAEKVSIALISMPQNSIAALSAGSAGWTIPLNYQSVHDCLKELKVGLYKDFGKITLTDIFRKYWILILSDILTLAFLVWFLTNRIILNKKIKAAHKDLESAVDERVRIEKELGKDERKLAQAIQGNSIPTFMIDNKHIITHWNKACENLTGFSATEMLGTKKHWRAFYPSEGPVLADLLVDETIEQDIIAYYRGKVHKSVFIEGAYEGGLFFPHLGEKGKYLFFTATPLRDQSGTIIGIIETLQDFTDRRQAERSLRASEEKYRSILDAMEDATYICSQDFHIVFNNSAMIKRMGRDATGETCYTAIHGLDKKCPWCIHEKAMRGESSTVEVESPKDNKVYHVSNSPIFHIDGSISKLTVFRDITDIKKMEQRFQQAQKMEAIGTLAGGIAHDFNNILFPIIGHTEMLMEDAPEGSPFLESLHQIYSGALRAKDLVQQILAFSRQEENGLIVMKIQPIIKEVMKLMRSTLPATIHIKQNLQPDCGVVKADPTKIHQIVMNLTTNAYHAMEDNGGELKLTLKGVELGEHDLMNPDMAPGLYACLTIADTGKGMDKDVINKIFEPFFTTKEKGKGTGMGLSVVHGIVQSMCGAIQVYSEPGQGTEFHVFLPIVKRNFEKQEDQTIEPLQGGTERVLLVDDEESIITMEKRQLERLGYQVVSRTSSIEALEAFKANPNKFDLVISDLAMPKMPGDKLAHELIKI
ncbi:MAG: PhnD/SsuA/transferrin family substrate-binding protein, partial [Desulfobacula sp.]